MKRHATDETVIAFLEAVYPGNVALVTAAFDEQTVLTEAARQLRQMRADAVRAGTRYSDMLTSQQGRLARSVWAAYQEGWTHCRQSRHKGPKGWEHSDAKRRLMEEPV